MPSAANPPHLRTPPGGEGPTAGGVTPRLLLTAQGYGATSGNHLRTYYTGRQIKQEPFSLGNKVKQGPIALGVKINKSFFPWGDKIKQGPILGGQEN